MPTPVNPPAQSTTNTDEPDQQTLLEQMGGLGGIVSSTLPILVVIFGNKYWGLVPTLLGALAVAAAIFVWRLVRKENLQPAISGFIGVAIGAGIAWVTGDAKGYFLYGIWMSLLFAIVFVVSMIVRWPMVGVIWLGINGHSTAWRKVTAARRHYQVATAAWAVVFLARFIVQRHFYTIDATDALGIAKILMGWPLTALVVILTVWMVKRASRDIEDYENATGEVIIAREPDTAPDQPGP
ncbi:DUF3159 domain-containing protein, partial [Corynebacterium mendelii]